MAGQAYRPEHMADADALYSRMVAREGLYGVAFFGHGCARQRRRCNALWRRAQRLAANGQTV